MTIKITNPITSIEQYQQAVRSITSLRPHSAGMPGTIEYQPSRYVWRGQCDVDWEVTSAIHRDYRIRYRENPDEDSLQAYERRLAKEVAEWGLDWHPSGGRLTGLDLLARMQHHGIPTRLIDVTSNPLIALWFAVADAIDDDFDATDGCVFVWDAHPSVPPEWATMGSPPWLGGNLNVGDEWGQSHLFWSPPPLDERITRQSGSFIVSKMPGDESESSLSVQFEDVDYVTDDGRVRRGRGRTNTRLVIAGVSKVQMLTDLREHYGIDAKNLFPDADGFREYRLNEVSESEWTPVIQGYPRSVIHARLLRRVWDYDDTMRLDALVKELGIITGMDPEDPSNPIKHILCFDDGWVIQLSGLFGEDKLDVIGDQLTVWAGIDRKQYEDRWRSVGKEPSFKYKIRVELRSLS